MLPSKPEISKTMHYGILIDTTYSWPVQLWEWVLWRSVVASHLRSWYRTAQIRSSQRFQIRRCPKYQCSSLHLWCSWLYSLSVEGKTWHVYRQFWPAKYCWVYITFESESPILHEYAQCLFLRNRQSMWRTHAGIVTKPYVPNRSGPNQSHAPFCIMSISYICCVCISSVHPCISCTTTKALF